MIAVLKPIIFAFLQSNSVKNLVVELLEAYAKTTDNTIDDAAVKMVKDCAIIKSNQQPPGVAFLWTHLTPTLNS